MISSATLRRPDHLINRPGYSPWSSDVGAGFSRPFGYPAVNAGCTNRFRGAYPGRAGRGRAGRYPRRRPRRCRRARRGRSSLLRSRAPGRRHPRLHEPGRRGQPQRRAHGGAARRLPRRRSRTNRESAVRLGPAGDRERVAGDQSRRRRCVRRRRRREHDARALRDAQVGRAVESPGAANRGLDRRLALRQPEDEIRVDDLARHDRGESREGYRITREEQDAFALESQRRAACAIREGMFNDEIVPVEISDGKRQRR